MTRWWLCLLIASVVSTDVAKFCGMMDVPFPLWIGMGLGSERNAVTLMFVRRDGPTRDSRFTTGVSVHPEGNHLAINSGNSVFQDTIRRVFRPIPVEAASIDLEYNEDRKVYYFRIMIGHEDRSVTLSQTYCKYAGMNGEFCGSTQRDSQKVTLVANIHAKEAQGSLRYITPSRQLHVEDTSFFLMRDGIVEFDISARPFGRFLNSMRHRDDCVRKLRGEYNSMTDRVHFWLTRTGGDPVEFVMDRFLCQYPVLGGLYDGIVMFVHVDRLRQNMTFRSRRYNGVLNFKDIDRESGFVTLVDPPYGLAVFYHTQKDELKVKLGDQSYILVFRELVGDSESI